MRRSGLFQRQIVAGVSIAVASILLSACNGPALSTRPPLTVIGVESQYANVLAQIGGRYVQASAVLNNPSADPHSFEPSVQTAQEVARAAIVVANGAGYDTFITPIETATAGTNRRIITVSALLGVSSDVRNPHLWYRPDAMERVARTIAGDLATFLPSDRHYFQRRLQSFDRAIAAWHRLIAQARRALHGDAVSVTEPVGDYLLSAMGLYIATPFSFQADNMNGVDPAPEAITQEQALLRTHQVQLLCFNRQVQTSLTDDLIATARQANVPTCGLYETLPSGENYQQWMISTTNTILHDLLPGGTA
jgi:zinc/manganese transport system substrate-binding protein